MGIQKMMGNYGGTAPKACGKTCRAWGALPTDYRSTGQRLEAGLGLYAMGARWYDPGLARWLSADTIVPEPGNPQSLNRYSCVYNRPLTYTDSSGNIPIPLIIGAGILIFKVVDYGWTAWDSYHSLKVVNDPNASQADKAEAAANLAMTAAFEAVEPDDILPVALPLDDLMRKGILKLGKEVGQEAAEQAGKDAAARGLRSFTEGNFRHNLKVLKGEAPGWMRKAEAHHVLPQEFIEQFEQAGLDNHDPEASPHRGWSWEYNVKWREFFRNNPSPSTEEILRFAQQLAEEYGFDVYFEVH